MPSPPADLQLQPADEGHIEAVARLWAEAFPEKPAERRARELREGLVYGDLSDCWRVEVDGRLAGALRTYRMKLWFRGRAVPTMGLAGVAVAPDFRRRGIGRRMCLASLALARERGDVLSALYPFRTSFYRSMGYVLAGTLHQYRFSPGDLPVYPGWDRVERAPDEGPSEARRIYSEVARASNGLLERTERMWGFLGADGAYLYLHRDPRGRATGYVVVRGRGGPPERSRLRVKELVAGDREAYLGLLGWLSVQRDQWGRITYDALPGEEFHRRLGHPRVAGSGSPRGLWFNSATLLRGPMLRILDLEKALAGSHDGADTPQASEGEEEGPPGPAGVPGPGLVVRDSQLASNQGRWEGGRRVSERVGDGDRDVLTIGDVTALWVEGRLPGQPTAPDGWRPNLGLADMRLLDEF